MDAKKKMFVMMPFKDSFRFVYKVAIRDAAQKTGYEALTSEDLHGPISINRVIIEEICRSDILIADISEANPNVFYELGGAHSVFKHNRVIMIARKGVDIPFDLKVYQVVFYEEDIKGLEKLASDLIEQIEFLGKTPEISKNPWVDFRPPYFTGGYGVIIRESDSQEPNLIDELQNKSLKSLRIFGKNLLPIFDGKVPVLGNALKENPKCTLEFMIPGRKDTSEDADKFKRLFLQFLVSIDRDYTLESTIHFYNNVVIRSFHTFMRRLKDEYDVESARISLFLTPSLPMLSQFFFDFVQDKESYVRVKHLLPITFGSSMPRFDIYKTEVELYDSYNKMWHNLKTKGEVFHDGDKW